jgi:murein DD-endopeptidase MepM/ murein hydrolase activator NlpD
MSLVGSPVSASSPLSALALSPVVVDAQRLQGPDTVAISGTIHSSLMASLDHSGVGEFPKGQRRSLAWKLADIFEHRIDMARDLAEGDQFHILVERLQEPNGKVIANKILAARLSVRKHVFEAVHFKSHDSNSEWFDAKGKSLTSSFLMAPLAFSRISSVFGGREHPIFGLWRNHTGTDYAAPIGTPVHAIGDGVVVSAGWMGGYGNAIDIRHSNGYISRYGHLSRIGNGIYPGKRVNMGTTIGYVGMTGWATGPHLHFEIRINGVAHDPMVALQGKSGSPLPASEARLFQEIREHTMSALSGEQDGATSHVAMRGTTTNSSTSPQTRLAQAGR